MFRYKKRHLGIAVLLILVIAISLRSSHIFNKQTATDQVKPQADSSPPAKMNAVQAAPVAGLPNENYDIVIIGSELEGMYLARAAADEGLRVKVLDPREQPGGQLLQGEMLFMDEAWDDHHKSLYQGRVKDLMEGYKKGSIRKLSEFTAYYDKLSAHIPMESGIQIDHVVAVQSKEKHQKVQILTYRTNSNEMKQVTAAYYVENTDNAALIQKLNANRLADLGQFYHQKNIEYMAGSMMIKVKGVDWKKFNTAFNKLTSAQKAILYGGGYVNNNFALGLSGVTNQYKSDSSNVYLRGMNAVNQRDGEVLINALLLYNVDPANPESIAAAEKSGRDAIPLVIQQLRRNLVGWENAQLNGYPPYLYIREYNHYETEYVLQISDLLSGHMFYDNVSIGGYPIDIQGTNTNRVGIELGRPDKYGMPLRSFMLKNYDNVIVAGKNVGSSALAYGSTRIQQNTSIAAESIGIILGRIQGKKTLSDLSAADWPALHDYLDKQYHIKLTGVIGANKLKGWSEAEISKLDQGQIVYTTYKRPVKNKPKAMKH
jgi:ribosomal protein L18